MKKLLAILAISLLSMAAMPAQAAHYVGTTTCYAIGPAGSCATEAKQRQVARAFIEIQLGCSPYDGFICTAVPGWSYWVHLKIMTGGDYEQGHWEATALYVPPNDTDFMTWSNVGYTQSCSDGGSGRAR